MEGAFHQDGFGPSRDEIASRGSLNQRKVRGDSILSPKGRGIYVGDAAPPQTRLKGLLVSLSYDVLVNSQASHCLVLSVAICFEDKSLRTFNVNC